MAFGPGCVGILRRAAFTSDMLRLSGEGGASVGVGVYGSLLSWKELMCLRLTSSAQ